MRRKPKPGFMLVARREWRWLLRDRTALILIFGVPLFAFAVLTAVFSHPVIRELGIVIVDADRSEKLAGLRGGGGGVARAQHRRARQRSGRGRARNPLRRGHRRRLPACRFRARPEGRAPSASGRLLQSAVSHRRGYRLIGSERRPHRRCQARGRAHGAESVAHRLARRRDHRSGQSAAELRTVSPAHAAADGAACDHRALGRLCGGLGVRPPQHARMARLRGRQSDCGTRWQACSAVRNFLRHHAVGAAHLGGTARDLVQGRRAYDRSCGVVADRRLFGIGRAGAASGARPRDWPRSHRPRRLAGIRLCRRGLSHLRNECVLTSVGRDTAGALVHGGAARAGGARLTAFRIRTPVRGAGDACRALLAACGPPVALGRAERDPAPHPLPRRGRRCDATRGRRRLRCGVAAGAGDPRRFHPAGGYATGLRRLLPATLSQ